MTLRQRLTVAIRLGTSLAIALGLVVLTVALARAATQEASTMVLEHFGSTLAESSKNLESGTRLELNGGWVEFHVGASDEPGAVEVQRLSQTCKGGKAFSDSDDDSGFVVCQSGMDDIDSLSAVMQIDPMEMGLRSFAYVDRAEGKTRYVQLQADDELTLGQLIPESGDAPGFDVAVAPRIEGLERWMSFRDQAGDYQAVFYGAGSQSPEATMAWYQEQLGAKGWKVQASASNEEEPHLFAVRGGTILLVTANDGCDDTCVSIITSSGGQRVR